MSDENGYGRPSGSAAAVYMATLEGDIMAELQRRSRNSRYQVDPVMWLWDVLGKRWWSKQEEIAWSFVQNTFTLVKSANGVGKTQLAGDLVTWWISVFDPMETIALVSAPVRNQIDENLFNYLRANYHLAAQRSRPLLGEITRWPKWVVHEPYEKDVVLPKRPADQNLISSFQGIHQRNVAVILDEAGGLQEDFYIGANAVTTNKHARILGIGNPDQRGTAFHNRFKSVENPDVPLDLDAQFTGEPSIEDIEADAVYRDPDGRWWRYGDQFRDWHRFTIRTRDLPTHTGEVVFPDDPQRQEDLLELLTQRSWTAMMERSASTGVIAAKVNGEFPDSDDNTFFAQTTINRAWETFSTLREKFAEMDQTEYGLLPRFLGVDTAWVGNDYNVIYLNIGGLVSRVDRWNKKDEGGEAGVQHEAVAARVHAAALEYGVTEVRIDATGTGSGVYSILLTNEKYRNRPYALIGITGANRPPDTRAYLNARAWHYDSFRNGMAAGLIGLDLSANRELKTDLEVQTFKRTQRQQLQITGKDELRKELKRSPDDLDAAIYSAIDFTAQTEGPLAGLKPGDVVVEDPYELMDYAPNGMPI